jgi:hypothetical protein
VRLAVSSRITFNAIAIYIKKLCSTSASIKLSFDTLRTLNYLR